MSKKIGNLVEPFSAHYIKQIKKGLSGTISDEQEYCKKLAFYISECLKANHFPETLKSYLIYNFTAIYQGEKSELCFSVTGEKGKSTRSFIERNYNIYQEIESLKSQGYTKTKAIEELRKKKGIFLNSDAIDKIHKEMARDIRLFEAEYPEN